MRKEKQLLLDEIKHHIGSYDSFLILKHLRLGANLANQFRRDVAKVGGNVEFVRKRVLIKAADASGVNLSIDQLPGHIGLVFLGQDPVETTKMLFKFSEDNEKVIQIIGGRLDKQLYNAEQIEMLSKLPGKTELRAQFLAVLEAPLSQTLAVMEALLSSVVYCLDNKVKQDDQKSS